MKQTEEFLDWLVELDIQHYKTEEFDNYTPRGKSHFYLKRSLERFTSEEVILVFTNEASNKLMSRWNDAITQSKR